MNLRFEPDGHRYFLDDREVPSVTTILEPYTLLDFVDPDVLERAAIFGDHVHYACHLYDTGELDEDTVDPEIDPYLDGWKAFLRDTGAVVIESERRVASAKLGYAGTLDKNLFWGKSKRMVDIKSGTVLPRTVGPQTAAYAEAYAEETAERIRDRYCVHLIGDGKYKTHKLSDPRDWSRFQAALILHQWFYSKHPHRRAA